MDRFIETHKFQLGPHIAENVVPSLTVTDNEVEGANLIKLHRHSGKVSYLVYPDFETDPHPALLRSIKLSLRTRELDCYK